MRLLLVSRVPIFTRRVRTHLECVFRPVRRKSSKVERCKLSVIVIHHIQFVVQSVAVPPHVGSRRVRSAVSLLEH